MWLEAILSREDLLAVIEQLVPLTIRLDAKGEEGDEDRHLTLYDPSEVSLVPDSGLRVVCKATVRWPVLGFRVPVSMHSLTVLLAPRIERIEGRDELTFWLQIEHADLAGVPQRLDVHITEKINDALAEKSIAWNFTKTLSHVFRMPPALEGVSGFELSVLGGKVKITEDVLGLAIAFKPRIVR